MQKPHFTPAAGCRPGWAYPSEAGPVDFVETFLAHHAVVTVRQFDEIFSCSAPAGEKLASARSFGPHLSRLIYLTEL
jgi:hypothetical protein